MAAVLIVIWNHDDSLEKKKDIGKKHVLEAVSLHDIPNPEIKLWCV